MPDRQLSVFQSNIRDNRDRGSVADFLRDQLRSNSRLSIVSAYFTIYAFEALQDELEAIEGLDFLFGEPRFIRSLGLETDKNAFEIVDSGIELSPRLQQSKLARDCERWITEKVNIRSIKQANLLHGKMYHIDHHGVTSAILGSSNFTLKGIGSAKENNNIELNLILDSDRDKQDLNRWFDELWDNSHLVEDVKESVINYLHQLYRDNAPEFIYYKTLYHVFKKFSDRAEESDYLARDQHLYDSKIWNYLLKFQQDGVIGAINRIRDHNGCIIADSVGLGKTFEALAVIKYFENLNHRVLVLCPKKLRSNWTVYHASNNSDLNLFLEDKFNYTVLSHTDLSRERGFSGDINLAMIKWENYDLVVIDESHNFRNNTRGRRDEDGQIISRSRYERLMEDIIAKGIPTKVLLLSATPVNTDLKDLRNQINFIVKNKDDAFSQTLGVSSIKQTLTIAQKEFSQWAKKKPHHSSELLEKLNSAFFTLLDGITIARSRKHIQKYYQEEIGNLGGFPERVKPLSLFSRIDRENNFLDYDEINDRISSYQLSLFNPSRYVLEDFQTLYLGDPQQRNFTQGNRERFLIGMIKVNFLKRLESSIYSFQITLERTIEKIKNLEEKIEKFQRREVQVIGSEDLEIDPLDDEELQAAFEVGKGFKYRLEHLQIDRWLVDLSKDRRQLEELYTRGKAIDIDRDAKLAELREIIARKIANPSLTKDGKENRKILIFTAFADTAKYLYEALETWVRQDLQVHIALVTGGNGGNRSTYGSSQFEHILTHFSPRSKNRALMPSLPQTEEIDILIATDCISEGQNLQDCDYLVNYDIHWNPVRIIQRFGRIDRIGSVNPTVQLINFWPTEDLNQYINLKNRVESRMALVDITATGEDNLLDGEELENLLTEEMSYRDRQLLRLKDEVLDLEDFDETVSLTEFTLDDFRIDLLNYLQRNRRALEEAPLGLYAVVPPLPGYDAIQPGIIFCLQQTEIPEESDRVNPLDPYFLVYIRDTGDIRYTFAQPKQILEIFRLLCSGKTTPDDALCHLWNLETDNGSKMDKQSELLKKAVNSIRQTFLKRMTGDLFKSGKGGMILPKTQQVTKTTDFELITWLIIYPGD